jgi:lysophospholipase L1-like esterase
VTGPVATGGETEDASPVIAVFDPQEITMKKLIMLALTVAVSFIPLGTTSIKASPQNKPTYYLSLGDSLSVGVQPNQSDLHRPFPFIGAGGFGGALSREGFSEQLAAIEGQTISNLHVVKLGCNGESTSSMINGPAELPGQTEHTVGLCNYRFGSQLDDAVAFLESHPGEVAFVTISIGANDVIPCGVNPACVLVALQAIQTNLPVILGRLRAAAGPGVPIVGMNYFSSAIVAWFEDPALAQLIKNLTVQANDVLEAIYLSAGSPVADVETAFSTTDFSLTPSGVPLNVARICQWTWRCTPFENSHPNPAGYGVIAQAFHQALP